jgi:transcriptional regulator with XRE-family HTH domain
VGIHEEVRALNLGSQIRQLRLKKGHTLKDVSLLTGLSKALLSQIENNIAAPPIATLLKISKALGVNIGYFFQECQSPDCIVVVRSQDRHEVMRRIHEEASSVGYRYEALAYPKTEKHMEPFIVEIEPRKEKDLIFYNHQGEEFLYVLDGEMEFRASEKVIRLEKGDSLYFESHIPHALRGLGGRKAIVIAVVYEAR